MESKKKTNFELLLPAMGEGIIEATITRWLISAGQHITIDQPLVEVATDKVDSEIPSPVEGVVSRLIYHEGEIPKVGEVIAVIETQNGVVSEIFKPANPDDILVKNSNTIKSIRSRQNEKGNNTINQHVTPLIRMLAAQRGLSASDLDYINGTGNKGEITLDDVNQYIIHGKKNKKRSFQVSAQPSNEPVLRPVNDIKLNPGDEMVEMDRMRKIIASHMIASKRIAAHVTSFLEADVTGLVKWRENNKQNFFNKENVRLTYTPVFIEIVASVLKDNPGVNISLSGESIIYRKNINIGIATALADGNLIVPVIKNADRDNLAGIARKLNDLAQRARNSALLPEEIKGGTFTITNIGQYNNLTGTPIINQPESAILAFGTILKKPWAVKTGETYGVAVRDILMLALTYDHRVIDGALGGKFLSAVAKQLETYNEN